MSEFSESYHLRSERAEDAIELLRRARRKGYVYQAVNGWVTFPAEDGIFQPDMTALETPIDHSQWTQRFRYTWILCQRRRAAEAKRWAL